MVAEEAEHAHNCRNQHDLSGQTHCLRRAAKLRVVRVADSCEAAVELEGVAEETAESLMLSELLHFAATLSISLHAAKLSLTEELRITIRSIATQAAG